MPNLADSFKNFDQKVNQSRSQLGWSDTKILDYLAHKDPGIGQKIQQSRQLYTSGTAPFKDDRELINWLANKFTGKTPTVASNPLENQSGAATAQTSTSATTQPVQSTHEAHTSIFGKVADTINNIYEKYTNLPVIKQASQAIGGVVSAVGAVEGGLIGGSLQAIQNVETGRPLTEDVVKQALYVGKKTAGFGYQTGKAGAAAAPLGGAGRVVNAIVAYGQGYQGFDDIVQGIKHNDANEVVQGGLALGTALVAAKGTFTNHGVLFDPEVVSEAQKLPAQARQSFLESQFKDTVNTYRDVLNMTQKEIQTEAKFNKNTPEVIAREGIRLEADKQGRLNTEAGIQTLEERIGPVVDILDQQLASDTAKKFNYETLRKSALDQISKDSMSAFEKQAAKDYVNKIIDAEIGQNGDVVDGQTLNKSKQGFWGMSFNPQETAVANDQAYRLGGIAKDMIEKGYKDTAIRETNQRIGELTQAKKLLQKVNGRVIKGGRLGNMFAKGTGALVGGMVGGIPGAIAGREIVGRVSDIVRSPSLRTGLRQSVLQKLGGVENVPNTRSLGGLPPEDLAVQKAALDKVKTSETDILAAYKAKHGNVINTDHFRPFFTEQGYNGANSAAVQQPSSYLAGKAFDQALQAPGDYVTFTSGMSGAGKTSSLGTLPSFQDAALTSAAVVDSNLSSIDTAETKIQKVIDAGKKPRVFYVYREPLEGFENGVVKRMLNNKSEMGRVVPTKVITQNAEGSWKVAEDLYKRGVDVNFIDNSNGAGNSKVVSYETLRSKVKFPKNLQALLDAKVKELYKRGKITSEQYKKYIQ